MTRSVFGPRRSSKALPKAKLTPQKSHGHCLVVCCPTGPLQLSESWRSHYSWEKYVQRMEEMHRNLQHLQPALANRTGPILLHDSAQQHVTQPTFNSWTHRAMKFCLICHIHLTSCQMTITSSSISITFCTETISTTSRRQKMLSKSSLNPKAWIFMLQESANLFLIGKNVLIAMVPILIHKDVFEPSYNDLKFMGQNLNYLFINLIYAHLYS